MGRSRSRNNIRSHSVGSSGRVGRARGWRGLLENAAAAYRVYDNLRSGSRSSESSYSRGSAPGMPGAPALKHVPAMENKARQGVIQKEVTVRKRKKKSKVTFKDLKKKVNKIEKELKEDEGYMAFRYVESYQQISTVNNCVFGEYLLSNPSTIESAVVSKIPYTNTAAPATKATFDATTLNYPIRYKLNLKCKMVVRNNGLQPGWLHWKVVASNSNDSNAPLTDLSAQLTIQNLTAALTNSTTHPGFYWSDCKNIGKFWKTVSSEKCFLNPGDECTIFHNEDFVYDPEDHDRQSESYMKKYSRFIILRSMGVVSHDKTTTTEVGISDTRFDIVLFKTFGVKVNTDVKFYSSYDTNNLDAQAAGAQIAGPNVVDIDGV